MSINSALTLAYNQLSTFAGLDDFWSRFDTAFGTNYDRAVALTFQSQWLAGDFSLFPSIEVVSDEVLGTANGAYGSNNTIYVSEQFLSTASELSLVALLLEEYGHFVDAQVNSVDSAGDEGAIFAALVQGDSLSISTLQALKVEDDHETIVINGEVISVEQQNFTGTNGDDNITGTSGNDVISPLLGDDNVDGGAGNDLLIVDYSTSTSTGIYNGIYSVIISSSLGGFDGYFYVNSEPYYPDDFSNVSFSNIEQFQITGTGAPDLIYTGSGNDTINSGAGNDYISSGTGNDTINSGAGDDYIRDDYISSGTGNDIVNGGDGVDTVFLDLSSSTSNLTLDTTGTTIISPTGSTLSNVEVFSVTTGSGNDTINSGAGNDTINSGTGNDTINSGAGDDYISSGTGNDIVNGGDGVDTVFFDWSSSTSNLTLDTTGTTIISPTGSTLSNVEVFRVSTGSGNDTIKLKDYYNDQIFSGAGNDVIDGGTGNNYLDGGTGNDTYIVNTTSGTVSENANAGTDTVQSSVTLTLAANVENLTLTGSSNINGRGNSANNIITGNSANNTLNGGAGVDTLIGGTGNDSLIGGNGNDFAYYYSSTGSVTVNLATGTASDGLGGTDTLSFIENVQGSNTAGDNLTGNTGVNVLYGYGGADILTGGGGNDLLYLGSDTVTDTVNYASGDGTDTVYNFVRGVGGDLLNFTGITAIDVQVSGSNTLFKVGDGISGNSGFGSGTLLLTTSATTGFVAADVNVNLSGATFAFS